MEIIISHQTCMELTDISELTGISYRTLYDRFRANKFDGHTTCGVTYMNLPRHYACFNILKSFKNSNITQIKINFELIEKISTTKSTHLTLKTQQLLQFLIDLTNINQLQQDGGVFDLHFYINDDGSVTVPWIHLLDNKKLISQHPMFTEDAPVIQRLKDINDEIIYLLKNKYLINVDLFACGAGGIYNINGSGYTTVSQGYHL